jgi:hypothetical protein
LIDQYGATDGDSQDPNFVVKELTLMENDSIIKVEFYEPVLKDLDSFSDLFVRTMKDNKFDGLVLVCAHTDK